MPTSKALLCITLLLTELLAFSAMAAPTNDERPKIGLALCGGGARGAAHIGVLKVLEELRVPVDYIAGTSMGSIIGGLYASGMSPEEIETAFQAIDWDHIFSDDPPREKRSFRRKRDDDLYLVKSKPGISDNGELKFPTGAIQGQKFDLELRDLTLPVSNVTDFDRLSIPFRAVAAEISTGKRVVLGSGDLATAMRASMAVPGVFSAAEIDGKLLVDGGIVDNLPIDVVKEMGADIVIAVDISTPYLPPDELNNLFAITSQLTRLLTRKNVEQQLATLTDRDVLIVPDLGDISSSDFAQAARVAAPTGRSAAEAQQDKLARLAMSPNAYQMHLSGRDRRQPDRLPLIEFVRVVNNSNVDDDLVRDRLHQTLGAPFDREQLEGDIEDIYGLELFQTVGYQIVEENGRTGLVVNARARGWGPNYLQLGLQMTADGEGENSYNFGFAYLRTGINAMNGEIRTALQLGEEPNIAAEWYQPLDPLSRYFITPKASYGARNIGLYDGGEAHLADFRVTEAELDLAAGRNLSVFGEARLGYRYRSGDVNLQTGSPIWPEYDYDTAQVYGRLSGDTLNNFNFPERGWLASLEYRLARKSLGSDADFSQLSARANRYQTFGDGHVVGLGGLLETTFDGNAAIQDRYRIGGFLYLSGYDQNSLSGQQAGVVSAVYYHRFNLLPFLSWYAGGSLEYGGVWDNNNDIGDDGIAAGSAFLGADTPVGPVYLGYGLAEGGHNAIFFYLGRPLFR